MNDSECPRKSLERCLAFSARDWYADKRDAWIWGIVFGWDAESMKEIAELHGWSDKTVSRLRRLHEIFDHAFSKQRKA